MIRRVEPDHLHDDPWRSEGDLLGATPEIRLGLLPPGMVVTSAVPAATVTAPALVAVAAAIHALVRSVLGAALVSVIAPLVPMLALGLWDPARRVRSWRLRRRGRCGGGRRHWLCYDTVYTDLGLIVSREVNEK